MTTASPAPDFTNSNERGRSFVGLDLTGANFTGADLRPIPDTETPPSADNLRRADFSTAVLTDSVFRSVRASRALFVDAQCAGADFTRADLTQTDFSGADLSGCNLTGANFAGSNLTGVNFTGATIDRTNFALCNLADVVDLEED